MRTAQPSRQDPLRALRLRLTLLAAALTGAVLVVMALTALTLSEGQLRRAGETAVQSNINAIVAKIQTDRTLSFTWLAQTEAADRLILAVSDNGKPLRFSGAWTPETERAVLIERARTASRAAGVDPDAPPISVIEHTSSPLLEIRGDLGERYLAAVVLIPAHGGYQSLTLLRDMRAADRELAVLRVSFVALVAVGVAALFGLCWVFAGKAIKPIAESQRRQAEFIAAASHELRSPLAVIRTSASAMEVAPEETPRLRGSIDRECARMGRLVDDLLTLARSDAGTWSVSHERVDLDTLLLETADGFFPVAGQKKQVLTLDVPEETLPTVMGDSQRLRQILTVLLDNACSYTPEGGRITLSARTDGKWARLRVCDTGVGIPKESLPHIFERFYRADAARNDKSHFGLGLSIASELAQLHGGELRVAETSSGGSTFELKLPL